MKNLKETLNYVNKAAVGIRNLMSNNYTSTASNHILEAGMVLTYIASPELKDELEKDGMPVIAPPTQETVVAYVGDIVSNISAAIEGIKDSLKESMENNEESTDGAVNGLLATSAMSSLIKALAFVEVYYEQVKSEQEQFDNYKIAQEKATTVVIMINEDMNHKLASAMIKRVWQDVFKKEKVVFHHDWQPMINDLMVAENIHFDNITCDDCLKQYKKEETIFYALGYKQGDKIPAFEGLSDESFVVML